jgi:hypothetical protein
VKLTHNKKKIVNDPVYGFITIQYELLFDIIEHPWFQRLRRIRQLGLTDYVYPGAQHTRFHHALGAMHLMSLAIESLRSKGHEITDEENLAAQAAILLHDIGHGPFSHALENSIVNGLNHEQLSLLFMRKLNTHFEGKLEMAIAIFTDNYHKKFLHQLLSSQLDVDRLDYLNRDSFYTGVAEGTVGSDRIIKMMEVVNGELVLEEKGIYSIEKFLLARRLMYWQVYLHKTVLAAENLLVNMLKRAKYLAQNGEVVFATKGLNYFLNSTNSTYNENLDDEFIEHFSHLDDYDIFAAAKEWMSHTDKILVELSTRLIERKLFKIRIEDQPFKESEIAQLKALWQLKGNSEQDAFYYIFTGEITNSAYKSGEEKINILLKNGTIRDVRDASDQLRLSVYSESIRKYFLCYPKEIDIIN